MNIEQNRIMFYHIFSLCFIIFHYCKPSYATTVIIIQIHKFDSLFLQLLLRIVQYTDELMRCPQYSEFKSDCFVRQRRIEIPCALLIVDNTINNTTKMSIGVSFPRTVKKNRARLERMRVLQTSAMLFRNLLEHTKGCHPSRRRWRCHT